MALKIKPVVKKVTGVTDWLKMLTDEDKAEAEDYLRHPSMYGHKELAAAFAAHEPPFEGSDKSIAYWREKNLDA